MDEERKKRIAEFRFGVIHDLVGVRRLTRGEKKRILSEKSSCEWDIPYSGRSRLSRSTILHWVRLYERCGRRLEGLYPNERDDKGKMRVLDEEATLSLINLKKELKGAALPVILKEAKERKMVSVDFSVSPATIYRLFKRHGLMEGETKCIDRRRFEAELPNDIWQSDCMHGPMIDVLGKFKKSYLFAFIDDMSRLIPHAEFYGHERLDSYIDALLKALKKRGLPRKLYVDNGPTFRSHQLSYATASLGIAIIHSKPYQPEGRGKIERWFKTVRMQFLCGIPDGLSIKELNRRLNEWIDKEYHQRVHSSTDETPLNRYIEHIHLIREAPKDLEDYFRRSRTVSLLGRIYEAPVELIGKTVTLLYHEHDPSRIEVLYDNKSYGMLLQLDVNVNCRVRRQQRVTEIIPVDNGQGGEPVKTEDIYKGGKLFEKEGEEDDKL